MTRKSWITLVLLLTFFFSLSISSSQAQMKPKVTLTEDWILYGAQLPEFLAAAKGYYAAEGLEVNIVRGYGPGDTVKKVASGTSEFGRVARRASATSWAGPAGPRSRSLPCPC